MSRILGFVAALLFAGSVLAQVAYVHEMSGQVIVRTGSGDRALAIGSLLQQGDSILTLASSSAVIKFEDGQLMVMHERSEFRISQYNYNKQNASASSAIFDLVRGGLRFVTGVIGATNRNSFQVRTPTATIGVRGTDGSVYYDAVTQVITAAVNQGALALNTASVNPGSPMTAGPGLPPSPATLTGAVLQALNTLSTRTGLPLNTPVVVATSARAAAAQALAADLALKAQQNPALKAQADQAAADAAAALAAAIAAGQQAVQDALKAGATLPPPPAPPSSPSGDTSGTTTGTTGTTSGSGSGTGSGGGGSGTPQ